MTEEEKQELREMIETQAELFTGFLSELYTTLQLDELIPNEKDVNKLIKDSR